MQLDAEAINAKNKNKTKNLKMMNANLNEHKCYSTGLSVCPSHGTLPKQIDSFKKIYLK